MKKELTSLSDVEVKEVSIVDRPANNRKFLLVKEENMGEVGKEVLLDKDGNMITKNEDAKVDTSTNKEDIFKDINIQLSSIEKNLSIDSELKRHIYKSLYPILERLSNVMTIADYVRTDNGVSGDSKLVPVLADELLEISKGIASLAKELGAPIKKNLESVANDVKPEDTKVDVSKAGAKMSTARLSQLVQAVELLNKLLSDVKGEMKLAKVETRVSTSNDSTDLNSMISKINAVAKSLKVPTISDIAKSTDSNSIDVDSKKSDVDTDDDSWPLDLNKKVTTDIEDIF